MLCIWAIACKPIPGSTQCLSEKSAQKGIHNPTIEFNSTKEFALCFQSEPSQPQGLINFIVLEIATCKIIEQGFFRPGYIKWASSNEIELLDLPGALEGDKDLTIFKKTISIKTQRK